MLGEVQGTSAIFAKVARARRRLRMQAAFEALATASCVALAAAVVVVFCARAGVISSLVAVIAGGTLIAAVGVVGVIAYSRTLPAAEVATRIDRASGLSDRLASACQFSAALDSGQKTGLAATPETRALMRAAILDAERALPRADEKRASPLSLPRDTRFALAFFAAFILIGGLALPDPGQRSSVLPTTAMTDATHPLEDAVALDEDDRAYAEQLIEELRQTAAETGDEDLKRFAADVEALLERAERGEITKAQLLEALARAEKKYSESQPRNTRDTLASLSATGEKLKKSPLTRELGKALERGDLKKAKAELEKLADKVASGKMSKAQKDALSEALKEAADAFDKRQEEKEKAASDQIERKKESIRKLARKMEQAPSEAQKRRLARKLDKEKRELSRLEREKQQRQDSPGKRHLERIHRNLREASQAMRQQNQKLAKKKLRDAAEKAGDIQREIRRLAKQGQTKSKMNDLREAMRRAKQRQQQNTRGPRDLFGKNKKNQDFKRRAAGGQGSRKVWRPGSGKEERLARTRPGQGQQPGQQGQGQKPGQQGQGQKPGQQAGDQHDPNLQGDPTKRMGHDRDVAVSGVNGPGPSRRETILSAAEKGFASRSYKKVYADYRAIVEEVIKAESVPPGYKYYVKKYFQKIKPH